VSLMGTSLSVFSQINARSNRGRSRSRRDSTRLLFSELGMYRGSGFLLQHAYTVHLGVIDQLVAPRFSVLWGQEFGSRICLICLTL
jgi:hypothetical protein